MILGLTLDAVAGSRSSHLNSGLDVGCRTTPHPSETVLWVGLTKGALWAGLLTGSVFWGLHSCVCWLHGSSIANGDLITVITGKKRALDVLISLRFPAHQRCRRAISRGNGYITTSNVFCAWSGAGHFSSSTAGTGQPPPDINCSVDSRTEHVTMNVDQWSGRAASEIKWAKVEEAARSRGVPSPWNPNAWHRRAHPIEVF